MILKHKRGSLQSHTDLPKRKKIMGDTPTFRYTGDFFLPRTNTTTNSFIYKIRMLPRTQMLQQTRRNTIGRRSTRVRMTFGPSRFDQSVSHHLCYRLYGCYQFGSVICLFAPLAVKIFFKIILLYNFSHEPAK